MPKYRFMSSYGVVGTTRSNGIGDCDNEEEALEEAFEAALHRLDTWVELVDEDEESKKDKS
jgi:hypothetical protein